MIDRATLEADGWAFTVDGDRCVARKGDVEQIFVSSAPLFFALRFASGDESVVTPEGVLAVTGETLAEDPPGVGP